MSFQQLYDEAVERFTKKGFVVDYQEYAPNLAVLRWHDEKGSSSYSIKFVFSDNNLFIDGDLGSAAFRLTEQATLEALASYRSRPGYFMEKALVTTDKYEYDYTEAKNALHSVLSRFLDVPSDDEDADSIDLPDLEYELLREFTSEEGFFSHGVLAILEKLDAGYDIREKLRYAGQEYSPRVALWLVALSMAWEQVKEK